MTIGFFDNTIETLRKSLNISAKRHSIITGNLANIDTIGYQPKDLDFHKTLQKEIGNTNGLARTHDKHIANSNRPSKLYVNTKDTYGNAENPDSVDIDTEMTNLIENNLKYRSCVEMLTRKINKLRHVIIEGGR